MDKRALQRVLEDFAEIDSAMPLSSLMTFVWVAQNGGKHQADLEKFLGTSTATASRAVQWWGDWRSFKDGKRGPGFMETYIDPADKRYRVIRMTPMGKKFADTVFKGETDGPPKS